MTKAKPRLHKEITAALDLTGLPWWVEQGGTHWKIRLAGRMAGILPYGTVKSIPGRAVTNTITQIKRAARECLNDGVQLQ